MDKLILEIVECPTNSYQIIGKDISRYFQEALEEANNMYKRFHDKAYRNLMFDNFNPLWTQDTISVNDIDAKDGFWSMNYFFFNISLVKILSQHFELKIIDKTKSPFRNQDYFFEFLENEGIEFQVLSNKKVSFPSVLYFKILIKNFLEDVIESSWNYLRFFKKEFLRSNRHAGKRLLNNKKRSSLYFYIPPIGNMTLDSYINWRYRKLFKYYEDKGKKIILFSIIDFERSESFKFQFININDLITWRDLFSITLKSIFYKWKVKQLIRKELKNQNISVPEKYFIRKIPTKLFYALKENCGYSKLFQQFGKGLLIMKGPIISKGAPLQTYNAKQKGIRVLSVSGRILTSTRLSNCFLDAYSDDRYPNILPHSMVVSDRISYNTIRNQSNEIDIHPLATNIESQVDGKQISNSITISLALQKRTEVEKLVDDVISITEKMEGVNVLLKQHPNFPIYWKLKEKFERVPFLKILDLETSLIETVENSDICITAYSSSALEFIKKGRPVIWVKYVTLNSLFFDEMFKKVGLTANGYEDLEAYIHRLKNDSEYYLNEKRKQYSQLKNLIYVSESRSASSFDSIIKNELEKI